MYIWYAICLIATFNHLYISHWNTKRQIIISQVLWRPSKQNTITSMFLPLASVTSRSPFSANLMVASCEREIPDIQHFLLLLRPFPICYHYHLTTSLNSSHGSMAPWLGPSSLGWESQFPVSSSKSSLYLKSKMIEIQKWKKDSRGQFKQSNDPEETNLSKDSSENNFFPTAGVYYLLDFLLNGSECRALLLQEVRHTLGVLANCCCLKIHPAESRKLPKSMHVRANNRVRCILAFIWMPNPLQSPNPHTFHA